jgi:hypothetical protein
MNAAVSLPERAAVAPTSRARPRRADRPSIPRALILACGVTLTSLVHVYFVNIGLPVVEVGGVFLIFAARFWGSRPIREQARRNRLTVLMSFGMLLAFFGSALWGQFAWGDIHPKAPLGLSLGVCALFAVVRSTGTPGYRREAQLALNIALTIHLTCWLLQAAWYYQTGEYLDFIAMLSGEPSRYRWASKELGFTLVRFTGLFAEPTIYATFVVMGLSIRAVASDFKLRVFDWALIATVVACLSLIGSFLLLTFLATSTARRFRSARAWVTVAAIIIPVGLAVATQPSSETFRYFTKRLSNPTADASGWDRLVRGFEFIAELPTDAKLFGVGLGNYEMSAGSTNGLAYLVEAFGLIGAAIVVLQFVALMRWNRLPPYAWFIVCASMIGAPLFSSPVWWVWLGLMVVQGRTTTAARVSSARGALGARAARSPEVQVDPLLDSSTTGPVPYGAGA